MIKDIGRLRIPSFRSLWSQPEVELVFHRCIITTAGSMYLMVAQDLLLSFVVAISAWIKVKNVPRLEQMV